MKTFWSSLALISMVSAEMVMVDTGSHSWRQRINLAKANKSMTWEPQVYDLSDEAARSNAEIFGVQMAEQTSIHFTVYENPTTGYVWSCEEIGANDILEITKTYEADSVPDGFVGSGGTATFEVTAPSVSEMEAAVINFSLNRTGTSNSADEVQVTLIIYDVPWL